MANAGATVSRNAGTLVFRGALTRDAVAGLWRQLQPLRQGRPDPGRPDAVTQLDLSAVSRVDSAGLALLAALAGGDTAGIVTTVVGAPAGLSELRAAYRLDAGLGFAR